MSILISRTWIEDVMPLIWGMVILITALAAALTAVLVARWARGRPIWPSRPAAEPEESADSTESAEEPARARWRELASGAAGWVRRRRSLLAQVGAVAVVVGVVFALAVVPRPKPAPRPPVRSSAPSAATRSSTPPPDAGVPDAPPVALDAGVAGGGGAAQAGTDRALSAAQAACATANQAVARAERAEDRAAAAEKAAARAEKMAEAAEKKAAEALRAAQAAQAATKTAPPPPPSAPPAARSRGLLAICQDFAAGSPGRVGCERRARQLEAGEP